MYQLILKKDQIKTNKTTAIHLIAALFLIIIGFMIFVTPISIGIFIAGKENYQSRIPEITWFNYLGIVYTIIGIGIILFTIFFNKKLFRKKKNQIIRIIEIICFSSILIHALINQWTMLSIYTGGVLGMIILIYFVEKALSKNKILNINENGVTIISKIKNSEWKWTTIKSMIIKNNVATINLANNKMYQFILDEKIEDNHTILKYIQEQLSKRKLIKNDW